MRDVHFSAKHRQVNLKDEGQIQLGWEGFSLILLPSVGGKIASIRMNGRELLQTPLTRSMARSRSMAFDASDASGWDECLPSVAACEIATAAGLVRIPDHGDLWRVPWQIVEDTPKKCAMRAHCFSLPLELTRTIAVIPIDIGFRIQLDYHLRNTGANIAPWAWSAHPLFAVDEGDRILLPESIHCVWVEGSGGERLGKGGDVVDWPIAKPFAKPAVDLSVTQAAESSRGDKLFAGPLKQHENWCVLERPSAGVRIRVSFDPSANPFLGLWLCYGGWPERPGCKQMCVALEPTTAPADSLASAPQWQRTLDPGASYSWWMTVEFQRI